MHYDCEAVCEQCLVQINFTGLFCSRGPCHLNIDTVSVFFFFLDICWCSYFTVWGQCSNWQALYENIFYLQYCHLDVWCSLCWFPLICCAACKWGAWDLRHTVFPCGSRPLAVHGPCENLKKEKKNVGSPCRNLKKNGILMTTNTFRTELKAGEARFFSFDRER